MLVHGLHAGSISTWSDGSNSFWPGRLADALGWTRILSFGYGSCDGSIQDKGSTKIFNLGEALCNDITDERTISRVSSNDSTPLRTSFTDHVEQATQSITFIGHGTGGVVIKSVRFLRTRDAGPMLTLVFRHFAMLTPDRIFMGSSSEKQIMWSSWTRRIWV